MQLCIVLNIEIMLFYPDLMIICIKFHGKLLQVLECKNRIKILTVLNINRHRTLLKHYKVNGMYKERYSIPLINCACMDPMIWEHILTPDSVICRLIVNRRYILIDIQM